MYGFGAEKVGTGVQKEEYSNSSLRTRMGSNDQMTASDLGANMVAGVSKMCRDAVDGEERCVMVSCILRRAGHVNAAQHKWFAFLQKKATALNLGCEV